MRSGLGLRLRGMSTNASRQEVAPGIERDDAVKDEKPLPLPTLLFHAFRKRSDGRPECICMRPENHPLHALEDSGKDRGKP